MKTKTIHEYTFTGPEIAVLKARILGQITEKEAAMRLRVSRSTVNNMISQYVMSEARGGRCEIC